MKNISKRDLLFIFFVVVIIASYFIVINSRLKGFTLESGDTAVAEQALWNTIQGDWFRQSFLENQNNFREHLNFVQFLYLPFYKALPNTLMLYFLIQLSYGIAALFLFYFIKKKIDYFWSVVLSLFFLLNPIVVLTNISAMHVVAVGAPFLLMALIFYDEKKYAPWLTFILLFSFTSEFIAPTAFFFGLLAFWEKRSWKWVLPPIIAGSFMYLLSMYYITIGFAKNSSIMQSFQLDNIANNNLKGRFSMLEEFLRPVLYIVPFFSKYFFIIIPTIFLDLVFINKGRLSSGSHLFTLVPVILVFAIFDVVRSSDPKKRKLILFALLLGWILSTPIWYKKMDLSSDKRVKEMNEAVTIVKDGGSVTASRDISYNLSRRSELYLVDNGKFTDYVVLDMSFWDSKDDRFKPYVDLVAGSDQYEKLMDKNKIVVYIKKDKLDDLKSKKLIK
jgi:uncharacterized membrane protein